jgi:hypothetical protein
MINDKVDEQLPDNSLNRLGVRISPKRCDHQPTTLNFVICHLEFVIP